ncbi:hypothetical protein RNJ44_00374 [Nakaseomyces bracarensis]|uniref:CAP-Gly domain-containing protein n=1 Tax=Nakaseomyces bracarensis TaxID=273131 RepID=A0ABR4NSD6_9SACH
MIYEPQFKVGDRFCVTKEICTVLFVGTIDAWPDEIAYGVEWDDPSSGKHSGTLGGVQYFITARPNSGSFLKARKVDTICGKPKEFFAAVKERYGSNNDSKLIDIKIGEKTVEQLGFDKLDLINQKWYRLETISLPSSQIGLAGIQDGTDVIRITDLDLSRNLFWDFKEILKISKCCPYLKSLNLSLNRFHGLRNYACEELVCEHLETLVISSCFLKRDDINDILYYFPNLKSLDISNNLLSDSDSSYLELPTTLISLNISGNIITDINSTLEKLPFLDNLNLGSTKSLGVFQNSNKYKLSSLDLSGINISHFDWLDKLNITFPRLQQLRCDIDKIIDYKSLDISVFDIVLARFNMLEVLNGSIITQKTRADSELYFVSKVQENAIIYNKDLPRWSELTKKYDLREVIVKKQDCWLLSDVITVNVKLKDIEDSPQFRLQLYNGFSVRYIRGVICQRLHIPVYAVTMSYEPPNGKLKYFPREFSSISDFSIENDGTLYIEKNLFPDN